MLVDKEKAQWRDSKKLTTSENTFPKAVIVRGPKTKKESKIRVNSVLDVLPQTQQYQANVQFVYLKSTGCISTNSHRHRSNQNLERPLQSLRRP